MVQIILENLKNVDNEISNKVLEIYEGKQDIKESSYYESTIFNNYLGYKNSFNTITGKLLSYTFKKIVNTPLIFIKGTDSQVFFSKENQGIAFGTTLVDYVTKKPLIIFVVDKAVTNYTYKCSLFNKQTGQYETKNVSKNCPTIKDLVNFVYEELGKNIETFVEA